jgi:L,D-transpeptidase ErfK/SrfK
VPTREADGLVTDVADRTLFWFRHGALEARFPVAVGRIDWATPAGRYRIVGRREDPIWHVPPSIQEEMRKRGEPVVTTVGPGPDNPLGKYWIQLSAAGYGLHGTNAPMSVGKVATHGCMRLLPEHVERLFHEAPDGLRVDVIDEPVKVGRDPQGRIWLEVHPDLYRGRPIQAADVVARLTAAGLGDAIDVVEAAGVVGRAWGTPEEVTRGQAFPEPGSAAAAGVSRSAAGP